MRPDLPWWDSADLGDERDDEDLPLIARDLMLGDFPPTTFVWGHHIVEGRPNLLTGDGGGQETALAIEIAIAVAAGKPLFDLPVKQMPCLLVLAEDDFGDVMARVQQTCDMLHVDWDELQVHFWCRPDRDNIIAVINEQGEI